MIFMAKKKIAEQRNVKVKAMVNLKYDKDVIKIKQEFFIRESDIEAMKDIVEVIGKVEKATDDNGQENEDDTGATEEE
jgi:hypothetical protein